MSNGYLILVLLAGPLTSLSDGGLSDPLAHQVAHNVPDDRRAYGATDHGAQLRAAVGSRLGARLPRIRLPSV